MAFLRWLTVGPFFFRLLNTADELNTLTAKPDNTNKYVSIYYNWFKQQQPNEQANRFW